MAWRIEKQQNGKFAIFSTRLGDYIVIDADPLHIAQLYAEKGVKVYLASLYEAWWIAFLVAEWAYLVLLYAGCREIADGKRVELRYALYALPLAAAAAAVLTRASVTFNDLFTVQAAIVSSGALASF